MMTDTLGFIKPALSRLACVQPGNQSNHCRKVRIALGLDAATLLSTGSILWQSSPVGGNRFPINLQEYSPGRSPCDLGGNLQRGGAQSLQECTVPVESGDVLAELFYVPDPVNQPRLHVAADLRTSLRHKRNAPAAHGFRDDETKACVKVLGHRKDVPDLMRQSDVLVLPSIEEGFGLVIAEAMGSGCVPLVSEACTEICSHMKTGLVHGVGNVEELCQHITTLHRDRALLERLRAASLEVAPKITWTSAGRVLLQVYRETIAAYRAGLPQNTACA